MDLLSILLYVGIGLVVVLAILGITIFILSKKKPELLAKLAGPILKTKKGKEVAGKAVAKQLAENPEIMTAGLSRQEKRVLDQKMAGRSEEEKAAIFAQTIDKSNKGIALDPTDLARRKTADQQRAAAKKKAKARAKRKQNRRKKR